MKKRGILFDKINNFKKNILNKKAMELEMLGWWILGLAVLVIIFIVIFMLRGKGIGFIEYIKDLLRGK
jgi:hypothetical protein